MTDLHSSDSFSAGTPATETAEDILVRRVFREYALYNSMARYAKASYVNALPQVREGLTGKDRPVSSDEVIYLSALTAGEFYKYMEAFATARAGRHGYRDSVQTALRSLPLADGMNDAQLMENLGDNIDARNDCLSEQAGKDSLKDIAEQTALDGLYALNAYTGFAARNHYFTQGTALASEQFRRDFIDAMDREEGLEELAPAPKACAETEFFQKVSAWLDRQILASQYVENATIASAQAHHVDDPVLLDRLTRESVYRSLCEDFRDLLKQLCDTGAYASTFARARDHEGDGGTDPARAALTGLLLLLEGEVKTLRGLKDEESIPYLSAAAMRLMTAMGQEFPVRLRATSAPQIQP